METCAAVSRNGLVTVDVTRLKPVVPGAWCPVIPVRADISLMSHKL